MKNVMETIVACLFGVFFLGNGLLMALSPRAWFRLPKWIGVHSRLKEEKHSIGLASIGVRVLGVILVALVSWVVYDAFRRR